MAGRKSGQSKSCQRLRHCLLAVLFSFVVLNWLCSAVDGEGKDALVQAQRTQQSLSTQKIQRNDEKQEKEGECDRKCTASGADRMPIHA